MYGWSDSYIVRVHSTGQLVTSKYVHYQGAGYQERCGVYERFFYYSSSRKVCLGMALVDSVPASGQNTMLQAATGIISLAESQYQQQMEEF